MQYVLVNKYDEIVTSVNLESEVGISGANEWCQKEMITNHIMVNDIENLAPEVSKVIRRVIKV